MKIQCNVCQAAEVAVICCADEAALCANCDHEVHAANKLVARHPRVPLTKASSLMPKCDICQEGNGYFFCLADRALFCRKCDTAIHSKNDLVSGHERYLITGVKVAVDKATTGNVPTSYSSVNSYSQHSSVNTISGPVEACAFPKLTFPVSSTGQYTEGLAVMDDGEFSPSSLFAAFGEGYSPEENSSLDNFLQFEDYTDQSFDFMEGSSSTSQADSGICSEILMDPMFY